LKVLLQPCAVLKICVFWYILVTIRFNEELHQVNHNMTTTCWGRESWKKVYQKLVWTQYFAWHTVIWAFVSLYYFKGWQGHHGRDRMVIGLTTIYAITTKVLSLNPTHGEVYSIQHVIKFVGELRQVSSFLWVLQFPPLIKLTTTIKLKYCWKWH
jgi:hypothetical protein